MTQREKTLTEKGYIYRCHYDRLDDAKALAERCRRAGWRATVLTESRQGIYFFSVWYKKKEA